MIILIYFPVLEYAIIYHLLEVCTLELILDNTHLLFFEKAIFGVFLLGNGYKFIKHRNLIIIKSLVNKLNINIIFFKKTLIIY